MNRTSNLTPALGEIYYMQFDGYENEQQGWRPGLVFQNNIGNVHSPNIIALPLTSSLKKLGQPTHVLIRAEDSGLPKDSMVLAENPRCLSKNKLGKYVTKLSDGYMKDVAHAFLVATAAVSFLGLEDLEEVWSKYH